MATMKLKVLILGSGAREHALCWKISMSSLLKKLYVAPGNAGTRDLAQYISLDLENFESIKNAIITHEIDMVVVGPEQPLVHGLVDYLKSDLTLSKLKIIGPDKQGAQLEGSKAFAKKFMGAEQIPTASYLEVTENNMAEGMAYLESMPAPYVLKADGLAAGKGVIITSDKVEAKNTLVEMLNGQFGLASSTVVIESFLDGIEFSVFALVSGEDYVIFPTAKDYKRIYDDDKGPNTGGMGAVSPVPFYDSELQEKVKNQIIEPTIRGLANRGIDYKGFIFFGLINCSGSPFVIEYNCRLGDPETQVIMPRLQNDLLDLFTKCSDGQLAHVPIVFSLDYVTNVVLASGGYPDKYSKGRPIQLEDIHADDLLFHAGTKVDGFKVVTNGGRVLSCCGRANTISSSMSKAMQLVDRIKFEGKTFRSDIGKDLI